MGLSRECCCLCFSVLLFFLSIFVIVRRCAHSQGLSFWFRWRVTGAVPCLPCPLYFDDVAASIFIADHAHSHSLCDPAHSIHNDSACPVLSCSSAYTACASFVFLAYVHMFKQTVSFFS